MHFLQICVIRLHLKQDLMGSKPHSLNQRQNTTAKIECRRVFLTYHCGIYYYPKGFHSSVAYACRSIDPNAWVTRQKEKEMEPNHQLSLAYTMYAMNKNFSICVASSVLSANLHYGYDNFHWRLLIPSLFHQWKKRSLVLVIKQEICSIQK